MQKSLITILGAGVAGIGMAATLKRFGITDFQVIDKGQVGQSFRQWSPYTHFISPSFNTAGFGFPDLNAVTPDTSPGMFLQSEHPSGPAFAAYLQAIADELQLPVICGEEIYHISYQDGYYHLTGKKDSYQSPYLILALGDYAFPYDGGIENAYLGIHYSQLGDYQHLTEAQTYSIIGGNEAAFDTAIALARRGYRSTIYTDRSAIDSQSYDPSQGLSLYTKHRYQQFAAAIEIKRGVRIQAIQKKGPLFTLISQDGSHFDSPTAPILATGFAAVKSPLIQDLFELDGTRPVLNEWDESTLLPDLFMVGPQVQHQNVILCYIYKYRQRFAVLAEEIARRQGLDLNQGQVQHYKDNQMYLADLSCCGTDCFC